MKHKNIIKLFSMLLMFSSTQLVAGTIVGTMHDFAATTTWTTEICVACHTPHNSAAVADAPLWNHAVTTQTFGLYSSLTMDATTGQPTGSSKLCLSCHDGVTAVDSFGGSTPVPTLMTGNANIGIDLSNDHPISMTYDVADVGLHPTNTAVTIGTGSNQEITGTIATTMLAGGMVQCSSCHDVHNGSVPTGEPFLLKVTKTGSAICLTCHNK